ncbi:MAG: hypothetical protein NC342_08000 [Pseudoflavonifractor sp.]|nr:hypothetical protein [Alloprevotella sp.]MCM1117463.1 hypothetical protein [Pseudoflavonifractor sp.]
MNTRHNKEIDNEIRQQLRAQQRPLRNDPWFTRRVANRLPRKRPPLVSLPEAAAFLAVLASSAIVAVCEIDRAMSLPSGDTFNPATLLAAGAMAAVATLYIAVPVVRRCLL